MVEEDIELVTFDGDTITKSDYRDEIIEDYVQANYDGLTKITDFTIGSEAYHLADLMARMKLEIKEQIDLNYQMLMIHTAVGEFLDNYGDMAGIHRKGSSPSTGTVTFTRLSSSTVSPIIIPDGSIVSTDDAISFIVDNDGEDLVIPSGETSCTAEVLCEQDGEFTNVEPGTIVLVMGGLGNMVSVTNSERMVDGADIEDDDEYRARILSAPNEVPTGSLMWYENVCNQLSCVHDVTVRKGTVISEGDIVICFNPVDRTDVVVDMELNDYNEDNDVESTSTGVMTRARENIVGTFLQPECDIAGVTLSYHLCEVEPVLVSDSSATYLYAVLVDDDYLLSDLKPDIIEAITNYNGLARVGMECSPHTLASFVDEVDGVSNCRVVKRTGTVDDYKYEEVATDILVDSDQIYSIDFTSIEDRIVPLRFSIDLTVEE